MAETAVRKSSRVKPRKSYMEDDFDFAYNLHFDVSDDILGILETPKRQRNRDGSSKKRKSLSSASKKSDKMSLSRKSDTKTSADVEKCGAFMAVSAHEGNSIKKNLEGCLLTCPLCKVLLASEQEMESHMAEHQGEAEKGSLICDICNRMCGDQTSYDRHMKSHSSDRKFKCEICDKAFTESCSLKRHYKSHDDDRPFVCELCFKTFRDNPSLQRHQVTHTDRPRMFHCKKCDKDFADKHTLKRHERSHSGLRPFECATCFKTFIEPGSFKRHLKIHSGVRSYICPICSRSFLEKQSLLRHQKNVCGFGGAVMVGSTTGNSSFSVHNIQDSGESGGDNSEESRASYIEGRTNIKNEKLMVNSHQDVKITSLSDVTSTKTGVNSLKTCEPAENSKSFNDSKEAPSLHSLIQKDPQLYKSISEIVEGIDSYEKMLDLCGETGQREIDAALTCEPAQMPDNLLCFECGEPLVNGENFKSQGKTFHPRLCSSFRCLNCDDNEDAYGDPPVLTAETSPADSSSSSNKNNNNSFNNNNNNNYNNEEVCNLRYEKCKSVKENLIENIFGADETIEHLREQLKSQHGVFFHGNRFYNNNYDDDDDNDDYDDDSTTNDQEQITGSNATTSRSHSTESEVVQTLDTVEGKDQIENSNVSDLNHDMSLELLTNKLLLKKSDLNHDLSPELLPNKPLVKVNSTEGQKVQHSVVPKMDYEADDVNIPTVFPCHLCPKVFATSAFLSRHLDLHKTTPYKCLVCGRTFTNSPSLKRHMTTHTGEKPYTCPFCRRKFRDPSNFSKHKKVCPAAHLAPSPAGSTFSASSSIPSFDDSSQGDHMMPAHIPGRNERPSLPANGSKGQVSHNAPPRFSYDSDDGDLPVRFSYSPVGSDTSPDLPHLLKGESAKSSIKIPPENNDLQEHRSEQKIKKANLPIPCPECEKTFENKQFLEMHMKYHSSNPKVTCIDCGKGFADPFGLKRHQRIHAGIRPYSCEYCDRGYCDNWSLKKHKSRGCVLLEIKVPADFLHPCPECNRVFSDVKYLDEHMKTHKGLLKFECDICQRRFTEASNLKRHRRLHMAICPGCDREFKDVQSLGEHQEKECPVAIPEPNGSNLRGFTCLECGRVYATKAYLERHKKFHTGFRPYACQICDKRFSESFRLRRHLKIHNDDRPYTCQACGKRFTDMGSLKRHNTISSCSNAREQQLQHGTVEFPCHFCDKIFFKNYLLARHMTVHSQERPFSCDQCGRTYKDTSSLRRHQLIHKGIRNFICPICGKDFFYSDSLKRHVSACTGKKPRAHHRPRGQGKRQRRSKYINSIVQENSTTTTEGRSQYPTSDQTWTSKKNSKVSKLIYQAYTTAAFMKHGQWSCHKSKHCWRCNQKFRTTAGFLKHSRRHYHNKPYYCTCCFLRLSRKLYWAVHVKTHKCRLEADD